MRLSHLTWAIALFAVCITASAQQPVAEGQGPTPELPRVLFGNSALPSQLVPTHQTESSKGLMLISEEFQALKQERPDRFSLRLPFPDGTEKTLQWSAFDVRSDAFEVTVTDESGHHGVDHDSNIATYELSGAGQSGVLILMEDHVLASFQQDGEGFEINPRSEEGVHAIFELADSKSQQTFSVPWMKWQRRNCREVSPQRCPPC